MYFRFVAPGLPGPGIYTSYERVFRTREHVILYKMPHMFYTFDAYHLRAIWQGTGIFHSLKTINR